jgi:hypothetical protein
LLEFLLIFGLHRGKMVVFSAEAIAEPKAEPLDLKLQFSGHQEA